MAVVVTGETAAEKELRLWDTPKRFGGYKPDGYEPYPKMLYKAVQREDGRMVCTEVDPRTGAMYGGTTRIVKDDLEHVRASREGWRDGPVAAVEQYEQDRLAIVQAAAEEAYRVARMSPAAQGEHQAATAATHEQVVEVPAPVLPPRSHKKKEPPVAQAEDFAAAR